MTSAFIKKYFNHDDAASRMEIKKIDLASWFVKLNLFAIRIY